MMTIMSAWDPANFAGKGSKHAAAARKLMRHALLQEPFAGRSLLKCIIASFTCRRCVICRSRRENPVRNSVPGVRQARGAKIGEEKSWREVVSMVTGLYSYARARMGALTQV